MSLEFQFMVNLWCKLNEYLANWWKLTSLRVIGRNGLFDGERV